MRLGGCLPAEATLVRLRRYSRLGVGLVDCGGTGTPLLLTRQFQAQSNRYARLVAPMIECIDLGAASNLMGVRICLTPSFEPIPIHLARPV